MGKLFGNNKVNVFDMEQGLDALHAHAKNTDPVGTIIWMDVDDNGNVINSSKQLPIMTPMQKLKTQVGTVSNSPAPAGRQYPYPTQEQATSRHAGDWLYTLALVVLVVGIIIGCGWLGWQAVVYRAALSGIIL